MFSVEEKLKCERFAECQLVRQLSGEGNRHFFLTFIVNQATNLILQFNTSNGCRP